MNVAIIIDQEVMIVSMLKELGLENAHGIWAPIDYTYAEIIKIMSWFLITHTW